MLKEVRNPKEEEYERNKMKEDDKYYEKICTEVNKL
jgi:hypothetical protein